MDLIEPQSDGCFFFSFSSLFLCNPLLSLELHLWNESGGRGRRGARHIFRYGRGLSCRWLIMAEAVFFFPPPGYIRIAGVWLTAKIIDHFCPLGRFSGGPKANTLYHTVSFKHPVPAASQPRICERKYLEPPPPCLNSPPTHTHTHTHTEKQADNDGIACQNPAPLTSDIRVIAFRCYLSCRYS